MKIVKLKLIRHFLISWILLLYGYPAVSADFFTSFEFTDTSGSFQRGTEPDTVRFINGEAKSIGVLSLYHSGSHTWMVDSGSTGTVELTTPAESVNLFFRDQNSSVNSVLKIFDTDGKELSSFNGNSGGWTQLDLNSASLGAPIARITLQNTGDSGYAVIDDFGFMTAEGNDDDPTPDPMPDPDPDNPIPNPDPGPNPDRITDPFPNPIEKGSIRISLRTIATGLTAPNWGTAAPGDDDHLYISDQNGIFWKINLVSGEKSQFLDLSSRLVPLGIFGPDSFDERGFLGFAFHPGYPTNGLLYTYTSEPANGTSDFSTLPAESVPDHKSVILEWQLNPGDDVLLMAKPESLRPILEIEQPQFNHDGGGMGFGTDKMLYISLGDGGGADDVDGQGFLGDPIIGHSNGNGQDTSNPLGALLRIDPEGSNSANGKYGIPGDNPFVGQNNAVDEIFAYGFRNPFRFSFDRKEGSLYVADVGQNDIEEVDIAVSGGNYGWNQREGGFVFNPNGNEDGFVTMGNPPEGMIDPVAEYDHDEGTAIIGGFVYRGRSLPEADGKYIFGDFQHPDGSNGRLFYNNNGKVEEFQLTQSDGLNINVMGFAQDAHGELYLLGNQTGVPFGTTGVVLKIVANSGFDGNLINIPVVDVMNAGELVDVYHAKLKLAPGSEPLLFELTQEVGLLPREYAGDHADFDLSNGRLSLPFVNLKDAEGNIMTYSAELQQTNTANGLAFELVDARLVK